MSTSTIKCRHPQCNVGIRMLLYPKTQKSAPIEAMPHADGNILVDLDHGTYTILSGDELQRARASGMSLHFNHFARCEFRGQFPKSPPTAIAATADIEEHQ